MNSTDTTRNISDTSRSQIGYKDPMLQNLAQKLASERKSIGEAYAHNSMDRNSRNAYYKDFQSVDILKSPNLPLLRQNMNHSVIHQSNNNSISQI